MRASLIRVSSTVLTDTVASSNHIDLMGSGRILRLPQLAFKSYIRSAMVRSEVCPSSVSGFSLQTLNSFLYSRIIKISTSASDSMVPPPQHTPPEI